MWLTPKTYFLFNFHNIVCFQYNYTSYKLKFYIKQKHTLTFSSMVRITTRGGIAKELEYEKNNDLISKPESHSRIILLFLWIAILLCTFFQILIILSVIFDTIPTLTKNLNNNFHKNYILSIMENGGVQLNSLENKYESVKLDFSFPQKTRLKFAYYNMEKFYFLNDRRTSDCNPNKYNTLISMENNDPSGRKYISKIKSYFIGGFSFQYQLQQRFSFVQVGSYLWVFGR